MTNITEQRIYVTIATSGIFSAIAGIVTLFVMSPDPEYLGTEVITKIGVAIVVAGFIGGTLAYKFPQAAGRILRLIV